LQHVTAESHANDAMILARMKRYRVTIEPTDEERALLK
jgi:hypothetical protein